MDSRTTLTLPLLLLLAGPAGAQNERTPDRDPSGPAEVERIYVPSKGFQRVIRRHPRGVLITEAELTKLLKLAGRTPATTTTPAPPAPLSASIQRLTVSGKVEQGVAVLTADAQVSVLAPGQIGLPLPLSGIGLRGVWVDGKPARVIVTSRGPEVLVPGGDSKSGAPVDRRVTSDFSLTVRPGEGRGAGLLGIPVPACGAGRLRIDLAGDLEVTSRTGSMPTRKGRLPGDRFVAWSTATEGRTLAQGAFGGGRTGGAQALLLSWRPRRALERVTPYSIATMQTRLVVEHGAVKLHSQIDLEVFRASRGAFKIEVPAGFSVTKLTLREGAVSKTQRGDRVDVRLDTPRRGKLRLNLHCDLTLAGGKRAQAHRLNLRPVRLLDVDRVTGVVGVERGPHTTLRFGEVTGVTRADLSAVRLAKVGANATLVRAYRYHDRGVQRAATLKLIAKPLEPEVRLDLNTTVQVREREVRALALYRFKVEQGSVFTLRALLPPGYALEDTLLSQNRRAVRHQLKVRKTKAGTELLAELEGGLTRGQQVLFAVEAVLERPRGLADTKLALPRFQGTPATRFSGHLGLAPDGAFRLRGTELSGLTAIPAKELQRRGGRGIEWEDIVLAYRIEQPSYAGAVTVAKKDSRLSAEIIAHHTIGEQTVATDAVLDLVVSGAPKQSLVLLFPPGVGKLARIEGPGARSDREPLGTNSDGWERFRIDFERPVVGNLRLRIRFETRLGTEEATVPHRVAKVSVEGAVRERGSIAVFSSGAMEVKETSESLRALDVTEFPRHPFRARDDERPLLAYTHVSHDYALNLSVTRHERADTLSAVAETLSLQTSVGPDGTARHTARFRVKNLANQYFELKLPESAVLWSVVVDGEGVKPAGEGGDRIIPIPTAGSKAPNQVTEVVATYTSQGSRWGTFGASDLVAPQLRFGKTAASVTDVVPVLKTRWALSLPDDYRVLEFAGNVDGKAVPGVQALAIAGWRGATRGNWPWLLVLGLLGLGVAASTTLRRGLLLGLVGARAVAREAKDGLGDVAVNAATNPGVRKGALITLGAVLVIGVGTVMFNTLGGAKSAAPRTAMLARSDMMTPSAGSDSAQKDAKAQQLFGRPVEEEASPETTVAESLRKVTKRSPRQRAEQRSKLFRGGKKSKPKKQNRRRPARLGRGRKAKNEKQDGKEGGDRGLMPGDKAPMDDEPMPPPAPKPTKPMAPKAPEPRRSNREPNKKSADAKPKVSFDEDNDDDAPDADMPKSDPAARPGNTPTVPNSGPAGKRDDVKDEQDKFGEDKKLPTTKDAPGEDGGGSGLVKELAKGEMFEVEEVEKAKFGALGGFGQVGLRSLVLDLAAVGKQAEFDRAGGHALVSVKFVKEALMVSVGGCLALLGFLAGLLLPRTGRLTAAGLLAVALVTITAIPVLLPGSAFTALLNALALGLILSAPALGLVALARWWGTAPFARLAKAMAEVAEEQESDSGASRPGASATSATAAVALAFVLFGAPDAAHADEPAASPAPPRVYIPYDPGQTDRSGKPVGKGTVFVPQEVFLELKRRASKGPTKTSQAAPPAPHIITGVDYQGELGPSGLRLTATVKVDMLAKGWQRAHLRLNGTGLKGSQVKGTGTSANGAKLARVTVAPAGGFELVAPGPASYTVTLDLIVPRRSGKYTFQTVPCLAAQMTIAAPNLGERRLVVDGAAAQLERPYKGKQTVFASLGDAERVTLLLRSRAVLSRGASEASAHTTSVVAVLPGRLELYSQTAFQISGAGREGFVFTLPEGFEATRVQVVEWVSQRRVRKLPVRGWSVTKQRLEISLRRPTGARAVVVVRGEKAIDPKAKTLIAPQLTAQGVSRETGTIGLATGSWQKIRPGKARGLRQTQASGLQNIATQLKLGQVQWAYKFARRPATLPIDLVQEAVEVQASSQVTAVVKKDRYQVSAEFEFSVRRGQLYEVRLAVPLGLELQRPVRGELKVSEISHAKGPTGWRIYTLGLKSALTGSADLKLEFEQRLVPSEVTSGNVSAIKAPGGDGISIPFPEIRPLGVSRERSNLGLAAADNLELRVEADPEGLVLRDVNEVTRGWNRPSGRARWQLGYTRPSRRGGLDAEPATVRVKRPTPYVEGSWVLHARVERDVVRYTLRALYQISRAGVDTFQFLVPKGIARQARVDAKNQREVEVAEVGDQLRYTVHLQSPVETFYGLSISWEALLGGERTIAIPAVNVTGIDRAVRGFVLVEKAAEVADRLQQTEMTGAARKGRAGDAPALPPGKGAQDFVLAYQVPLGKSAAWGITCQLKRRNVQHPPAARIPWAHISSVFTRDGRVRHRARYRVRNLRLQFLELALPEKAEVWSVFVARRPRRLHHKDGHALIPLPKRSAADLAFDVELIYTTKLDGSLGFGSLKVLAPVLKTPEIQVEKTFWTAYLPEDYQYRGFGGNVKRTSKLEVAVTTFVEAVQERARLEELARSGAGNQRLVADNDINSQAQRVAVQLKACETIDTSKLPDADRKKVEELLGLLQKQSLIAKQLEQASTQRRRAYAAEQQQQQKRQQLGQVQQLGQSRFVQLDRRSWNRNTTFFKKGNKERWANVARRGGSKGQVVLALPKSGRLSLRNMELLDRSRRRILRSSGYSSRLKEAKQAGLATGRYWRARKREDERERTRSADGLLSIQVDFPTPGRAFHS